MADSHPLAGLLDRAGKVFSLAGHLGREFHEVGQSRAIFFDPSLWQNYAPTFNEFCEGLLDLRDATENPPDGFAPVAERLLYAGKIAKGIRETLARDGGFTAYLDFFPSLNTAFQTGWEAIKEVTKSRRLDDPFGYVDKLTQAFSMLDRFPATPAGHVAFLEHVRDELHYAADAKRRQLAEKYPNATIESMVRGIHWPEAKRRVAAISKSDLPADAVEQVARVLRRELTPGTVEQIDDLLTPAVRALRDAWEYFQNPALPVGDIHDALLTVQCELENWNRFNSPSESGRLVEDIPAGHPLHSAVDVLQGHYDGALPKPAINHWRKLLRLARDDNEDAEVESERLLKWVNAEIQSQGGEAAFGRGEIVVVEPPEVIQLKEWLALDGIKGYWGHFIASAEFWRLEVDSRHRNITFLVRQVFGGDPPESAIRDYLFRHHGILPADPIDLATLEQLLRQDAESIRSPKTRADGAEQAAGSVRAGEAFRQAMESDPETRAGWERARERLQAIATAMQELMGSPEYKAAQAAERQRWRELADAIRETLQAAGDELATRHFARPETIEDWEHLARIVEIPAETIRTGNLTAREIFACALAWSDRQTIKAKLAAEANGGATKASEPAPNTRGTSAPADGNKYDVPQIDEYDDRVAWWIGKRIYLGRDTQVARLFWLLAKPAGRARTLAEVQRAVEDMETNADAGSTPEEIKKAAKRLRKVVSKLKAAMREAELDDHFVIHRGGSQREPEYSFVPRFRRRQVTLDHCSRKKVTEFPKEGSRIAPSF